MEQIDFIGGEGTWKRLAYPMPPGTGPEGETCGSCLHGCRVGHRTKKYWKCALMKWSHSEATDIKKSSPACQRWQPEPEDTGDDRDSTPD